MVLSIGDIARFIVDSLIRVVIRTVLIVLSFPIVAVALPFSTKTMEGSHLMVKLPTWAWLWSNDRDGACGDRRGSWAKNTPFGLPATSYFPMWWWLVIRNPVNNQRFCDWWSCDMSEAFVLTLAGQDNVRDRVGEDGWHFLGAKSPRGVFYSLYMVLPYSERRAFMLRIGTKIEPKHNHIDWSLEDPLKAMKSFTFKINPFTELSERR